MDIQQLQVCTIQIQELTTTILDTITHIQDIAISIIRIDMNIDTINFTITSITSIETPIIQIHQCHNMSIGVLTMGQKVCTRGDIKDYGIRTIVVMAGEAAGDK